MRPGAECVTAPPIPYPAETKAKGWRFELDYERIDQSGTWALAGRPGMEVCRPLLLMQWYVAWHQEPCGTLPADEQVIAALMGITDKTWQKHRGVLMRGWWLAADGLLYHPTITKRVMEMIDYRRKAAERVSKHKAKMREQHEGNALPTPGKTVNNDTGTGTGTSNTTPTTIAREAADTTVVFAMHAGWSPGLGFEVQAKLAGLPVNDAEFMASGTREFVGYWLTQAHESRTQAEWEHSLAQRLKHLKAGAASVKSPRQAAPRQSGHTGFDAKDYTAGVNKDGTLA